MAVHARGAARGAAGRKRPVRNRSAVTVVIPTRDRAPLLALTLRSVLNQQAVDIDVVVVDDGDGRETTALIDALEDPRIHVVRNCEARGVSGARNCGLNMARGEWVAFCDDDDLWAPVKLDSQLSAAIHEGVAWVYAGDVTVNTDLRVLYGSPPAAPNDVMRDLLRHNSVPAGASNVVARADALARAGPFDTGLRTSEDWDLWLRLARTAGRPACVPRPFVALRAHGRTASRHPERILADVEVIARRYQLPVDRARHHRWAAWMALEDGRRSAAICHYIDAVAAGDWRSVGRAAVALVDPHVVPRRSMSPDNSWVREAQAWLDTLHQAYGYLCR